MPLAPFGSTSPRPRWSRVSTLHDNVRSMLLGSSVYSQSPIVRQQEEEEPPKLPPLAFLRHSHTPSEHAAPAPEVEEDPTPARATAAAAPSPPVYGHSTPYSPASIPSTWERSSISLGRSTVESDSMRSAEVVDTVAPRAAKRHRRRRRKQKPQNVWVRRRNHRGILNHDLLRGRMRAKTLSLIVAGMFIAIILTIYLALALTSDSVAREVHILFIMCLIATTIVFCHALIRLCMLAARPTQTRRRYRVPSISGPQGFEPKSPIRVHLARDEEEALERAELPPEVKDAVKPPPPAYGLWRCSVRMNPNLLHWQRVDTPETPTEAHDRAAERVDGTPRRPPSYISDDGVDYVVSAQPRSTVRYSHAPAPLQQALGRAEEGQPRPDQRFQGPLNSHVPEFVIGLPGVGRPPSQLHPALRE